MIRVNICLIDALHIVASYECSMFEPTWHNTLCNSQILLPILSILLSVSEMSVKVTRDTGYIANTGIDLWEKKP